MRVTVGTVVGLIAAGRIRDEILREDPVPRTTRQRAPRDHGDEPLRILVRVIARQAARERFEREVAAERDYLQLWRPPA